MGSANVENCSQNDSNGQSVSDNTQRPVFIPCSDCGRRFTKRALEVHHQSCFENEYCNCYVCKDSKRKRLKTSYDHNNVSEELFKQQLQEFFKKSIHNGSKNLNLPQISTQVQNSLTDQNKNVFKVCSDAPNSTNIATENLNGEKGKLDDVLPNAVSDTESFEAHHDGEPCSRKLFCNVCKEHVFWVAFGTHTLQHCKKDASNHLQCPECSDSRSSPTYFLMHYYSHISSHPANCPQCRCNHPKCSDAGAVPLAEHCYAESVEHRCYICLKFFSHFQSLVNHMRLHSKEMPFSCPECKRSFRQIGNLQRHMTTHRGDRPHKCPNCCRSFADPATLRNHVRVHTGETPYICQVCRRGFSQVGNLKRHKALHAQKDGDALIALEDKEATTSPVSIPIVDVSGTSQIPGNTALIAKERASEAVPSSLPFPNVKDTIQKDSFKESEILPSVSSNKIPRKNDPLHACPNCGKKYAWKHDLDIHFRIHSGEKPYKCEICNKRFAQSGAVRIHKDRHHPSCTLSARGKKKL